MDKLEKKNDENRLKEDGHCPRSWILFCSLAVLLLAASVALINNNVKGFMSNLFYSDIMDEALRKVMEKYDYNRDLVLDVWEVRDLLHDLPDKEELDDVHGIKQHAVHEAAVQRGDEVVNITAHFSGIQLDTMSQDMSGGFDNPEFKYKPCFKGLVNWTSPYIRARQFLAEDFCTTFSTPNSKQKVGEVYWIVSKPHSSDGLTNRKYKPSSTKNKKESFLSALLGMFHPNVFTIMRFAPQGTAAVMRAQTERYIEVQFRIHAEFQLNHSPLPPFWFTPGRFEGSVTFSRDSSQCHVRQFFLNLPTENSLNVDMEWIQGETSSGEDTDNIEVDIGFVPDMSLQSISPSGPIVLQDDDVTVIDRRDLWKKGEDVEFHFDPIEWNDELQQGEAERLLEIAFHPFAEVEYLPFPEAFHQAILKNKPVHHLVLWGALNDQSC